MLKIWGRLSSINVRKIVWAARELQLPFERIDAGATFGITQTPDYLRKNPNALVPLLEDGDFSLWESNVILRYLFARQAALPPLHDAPSERPSLGPIQAQLSVERWLDWQQTTFNPAGRNAFIQLVRTAPELRNVQAVQGSVAATERLLEVLEAHLGHSDFMGGAAFGVADIPVGCEMHRWWGIPDEAFTDVDVKRLALANWPHVQRCGMHFATAPPPRA